MIRLTICSLAILAMAIAGCASAPPAELVSSGDPTPAPIVRAAQPFSLGTCYRGNQGSSAPQVACTEPHSAEVYHLGRFEHPAGAERPSDRELYDIGLGECTMQLESLVGQDATAASILVGAIPDQGLWWAGLREFACIATLQSLVDQPLTELDFDELVIGADLSGFEAED